MNVNLLQSGVHRTRIHGHQDPLCRLLAVTKTIKRDKSCARHGSLPSLRVSHPANHLVI